MLHRRGRANIRCVRPSVPSRCATRVGHAVCVTRAAVRAVTALVVNDRLAGCVSFGVDFDAEDEVESDRSSGGSSASSTRPGTRSMHVRSRSGESPYYPTNLPVVGGLRYDRAPRPTPRDLALSLGFVMTALDTFVLISGTFGVLSVLPLMYLAVRSVRDARDLRRIQYELAGLVTEAKELSEEVHELQREIQSDQRDAKTDGEHTRRTVEHVSETVEQVSSALEHVNEAVTAGTAAPPREDVPLVVELRDGSPGVVVRRG